MNNFIAPPPVRSPCVEVCELDPGKGLCRGSSRTQDERDWWVAYSNVQQRCEQRRAVPARGVGEPAPNMGIVEPRHRKQAGRKDLGKTKTAPIAGSRLKAGGDEWT